MTFYAIIFIFISQGNSMYGANDPNAKKVIQARRSPSQNGDGTRDASSDFSTVVNSGETIVITTRDQNGHSSVQKRVASIEESA